MNHQQASLMICLYAIAAIRMGVAGNLAKGLGEEKCKIASWLFSLIIVAFVSSLWRNAWEVAAITILAAFAMWLLPMGWAYLVTLQKNAQQEAKERRDAEAAKERRDAEAAKGKKEREAREREIAAKLFVSYIKPNHQLARVIYVGGYQTHINFYDGGETSCDRVMFTLAAWKGIQRHLLETEEGEIISINGIRFMATTDSTDWKKIQSLHILREKPPTPADTP